MLPGAGEEEEDALAGLGKEERGEGVSLRGCPPAIQTWVTHFVLSGFTAVCTVLLTHRPAFYNKGQDKKGGWGGGGVGGCENVNTYVCAQVWDGGQEKEEEGRRGCGHAYTQIRCNEKKEEGREGRRGKGGVWSYIHMKQSSLEWRAGQRRRGKEGTWTCIHTNHSS